MTPEQINRVMELVREYGTECYGEGSATNVDARRFYIRACQEALAKIEAELKGGGAE